VIASLDVVVCRMAGNDGEYDHDARNVEPHTQVLRRAIGVDDGVRRILEMVVAAVIP